MKSLTIIGNGIAGITLALEVRKKDSEVQIQVLSKEHPFFFSRPALMYIYMGHMRVEDTQPYENYTWEEKNIELIQTEVTSIDYSANKLRHSDGEIQFDKLVIATGSKPNFFDWPGINAKGVQGLYHMQDLHLLESNTPGTKSAVIIGGGLIGVELAEMLHMRGIEVTLLVREKYFWNSVLPKEDSVLVGEHILSRDIKIIAEDELESVQADEDQRVKSITTKKGQILDCQILGITVGVQPNIEFLKNNELKIDRGILIDHQFKTNFDNVYAIGDCAQFENPIEGRRPIEQVWYTGKMHGETLAHILTDSTELKYTPGIWFNSAKFVDMEYQTYGLFPAKPIDGTSNFYWRHQINDVSVHLHYSSDDDRIIAFNFFGTRARHVACEKWIAEGAKITEVLADLGWADFDPEFFPKYQQEIINKWNGENPNKQVSLKTPKGLFSRLAQKFHQPTQKVRVT